LSSLFVCLLFFLLIGALIMEIDVCVLVHSYICICTWLARNCRYLFICCILLMMYVHNDKFKNTTLILVLLILL
jgi:hypothetical protein